MQDVTTAHSEDFATEAFFLMVVDIPDDTCYIPIQDVADEAARGLLLDFLGEDVGGVYISFMNTILYHVPPLADGDDARMNYTAAFHTLYHELAHAWQDEYLESFDGTYARWEDTPAGQEFIEITGFTEINGEWQIGNQNYQNIYGSGGLGITTPEELSAELVAMGILFNYMTSDIAKEHYPSYFTNNENAVDVAWDFYATRRGLDHNVYNAIETGEIYDWINKHIWSKEYNE